MAVSLPTTIDGNPVLHSGTIVIPPGRTGALQIGSAVYSLRFSRRDGADPSFEAGQGMAGGSLTFTNFDNALGTHVNIAGFSISGVPAIISLVVYAIGDANPARIIHYSIFNA